MEDVQSSLPRSGAVLDRHRPPSVGVLLLTTDYEVTATSWKSGSVVRLLSGGEALRVIGCDSVGSVICRPLGDNRHLGIYIPPSMLMAAEAPSGDGAPAHSNDLAMESA